MRLAILPPPLIKMTPITREELEKEKLPYVLSYSKVNCDYAFKCLRAGGFQRCLDYELSQRCPFYISYKEQEEEK